MKKIIIEDEKSAVEYLEFVLSEWTTFCEAHPNITQAIEVLLKINKSMSEALILKCEYINEMKEYIHELHRKVESLLERSENGK